MELEKEKLEIFLITYNRKEHLQNTFNQIFALTSPIKDFPITILDNKSTDGTSELIQDYCQKFPNIKHIIHNRNIGGNGNIARAFEMASKEYFWILCDDDEFDFSHWNEVEAALKEDYDAILVANYVQPEKSIAYTLKQMTFVPSTIYKTKNITDTVMVNSMYCISTMFPQLALTCSLLNNKKKIHICKNWIVKMLLHCGEESYVRGLDTEVHPYLKDLFWHVGYINACQMIKEDKLRYELFQEMNPEGLSWEENLDFMLQHNQKEHNSFFKNYSDIFCGLTEKQQKEFVKELESPNLSFMKNNKKGYKQKIYGKRVKNLSLFDLLFLIFKNITRAFFNTLTLKKLRKRNRRK